MFFFFIDTICANWYYIDCMELKQVDLYDKAQTAQEMYRLIEKFFPDVHKILVKRCGNVKPFSSLNIEEAFDMVKNIPYRMDKPPIEVISRPAYIMRNSGLGMDCKKKAILLSAYLKSRGIPYRLIASSKRPSGRIHHVFPQVNIAGQWLNYDATYSHYKPFEKKFVTKAEVL